MADIRHRERAKKKVETTTTVGGTDYLLLSSIIVHRHSQCLKIDNNGLIIPIRNPDCKRSYLF